MLHIQAKISGEREERYLRFKQKNSIESDGEAIRKIFDTFFLLQDVRTVKDAIAPLKSSSSAAATYSLAQLFLLAMEQHKDRPDFSNLTFNQRLNLCFAAAGPYVQQSHGCKDIDAALASGRKHIRHSEDGKRIEAILHFLSETDSQIIFNTIDPCNLELWISGMFAYRKGSGDTYDFDYAVGVQNIVSILDFMGIKTKADAQEKFDGTWTFSNDCGWTRLSPIAIEEKAAVNPSDYTDAFDYLDPNPENYAAFEEDCQRLREVHEGYLNECKMQENKR